MTNLNYLVDFNPTNWPTNEPTNQFKCIADIFRSFSHTNSSPKRSPHRSKSCTAHNLKFDVESGKNLVQSGCLDVESGKNLVRIWLSNVDTIQTVNTIQTNSAQLLHVLCSSWDLKGRPQSRSFPVESCWCHLALMQKNFKHSGLWCLWWGKARSRQSSSYLSLSSSSYLSSSSSSSSSSCASSSYLSLSYFWLPPADCAKRP